ncbi:uncharacterized protein LOC111307894 isoform X4 [Durio zibethinus]|uniref:Uncharacterized protein LOC111307894 isoform X4 n=1 Tax=Durio zibethinus TaxID=66656 RepID=A0A6P6AAV0_DURZI|nr:uncharacterized protein LOC111307894 isoform X4 [Durio zibethinus]
MEDMDIDSVGDIPDTPDRSSSRRMNGGDSVDKESKLSVAGHVGGSNTAGEGSLDRLRDRGRLVGENGHNRKHYIHPRKLSVSVDEIERQKNTIVLSPLENAQENAPLFRKTTMERSRNAVGEQYMDKGKAPCSKLPSKSSGFREDHAILDLTKQNMHSQIPEMAFPQGGSKNRLAEGRKEVQLPRNGGSYLFNSSSNSATSRNNSKGKEKIDDIGFRTVGSVIGRGKGVGLSHGSPLGMEKQLPASHHSVVSPRAVWKKRLVRNGCISPQNIAKQLNEQSQNSFKSEQDFGNVVSNGPCMIDISEIIAEDNNYGKGKGALHPHTSKEHDINLSGRESSSSRSSRICTVQQLDVLDLDESSEMRSTNANHMGCVNDEDSKARARQVEADEMLARELQEQLYHEVPIFSNGEIEENIAWVLQLEEDELRPTAIQSLHEPDHRGSTRRSRVQPSSQTFQNSSNRRGVQAHFSTSARVSRSRSGVLNQPRITPSRTRNFRFPLDMRLDILEAMEAAIGDADDMGMASHIFQVQREFNENDYEMLLALDDNNHHHGGASITQINSLPLSKVQTDKFEEPCAICLETPAIGETIRHLPCLHKFHKDCIDPWLSQKTLCPVCKSSIT